MRTLLTVFRKEVIDNFRDRRTLASALLMGPLLGPMLFAFIINLSIERSLSDADKPMDLPVIGAEHAPNLARYLQSRNIILVDGPVDREAAIIAVTAGETDVVVIIPENFGQQLNKGVPALVELVSDQADQQAERDARRARGALRAYNQEIAALRLVGRGISPTVLQAVVVDEVDVSTPSGRAGILLGMMSYFFIFAMLMGGMYLAIDTTAGERERGSLESLLCVPVSRARLLLGKLLATGVFMAMSLLMSIIAFYVSVRFLPLEKINMVANFSLAIALKTFLIMLPFVVFGAAFMTIIATFSKTYKEAQSYLSMAMMLPTLPIMLAIFSSLKPQSSLMMVPSLSQHLLVTEMVKGIPLDPQAVAISVVSTLGLAAVLMALSIYRYYQESLLV